MFSYYHKTLQNGNTINKPKNWLIRATINKSIDHLKYQKRHLKIDNIKPIPVVEDSLEKNQEKEILKQALSELKPSERTLVILYSEGLTYKEIAEVSGIKFTSIGKMLSRAIKKMGEILKTIDDEMY